MMLRRIAAVLLRHAFDAPHTEYETTTLRLCRLSSSHFRSMFGLDGRIVGDTMQAHNSSALRSRKY